VVEVFGDGHRAGPREVGGGRREDVAGGRSRNAGATPNLSSAVDEWEVARRSRHFTPNCLCRGQIVQMTSMILSDRALKYLIRPGQGASVPGS
jgi:hypothetical protein